ncbi:MAG: hypothetical protein V1744_04745 [Candidatus Altiarchaeota archaeon]
MRSRGQTSGLDLVVAFMLVVFILVSVWEVWTSAITKLGLFQDKRTLDDRLLDVSELLVKTPGDPQNWHDMGEVNPDTVRSIGFALKDNVLDPAKMQRASTLEYESLRAILGLSKEDVYITIKDLESGNKTPLYAMGRPPEGGRSTLSRYAVLNGSMAEVSVSLYYANETYMTV